MTGTGEKRGGTRGREKTVRRLSADERDLWAHVAGDVRPLRKRSRAADQPFEPDEPRTPNETSAPERAPPPAPPAPPAKKTGAKPREVSAPRLGHGAHPGLDRRTATRLRRGQMAIEARIDLHGLDRDEARRALAGFIQGQREAGRRCVLVITGKGLGADGSVGVLRAAVPEWLNEAPLRRDVVSFVQARPRDGGEGAIYVLLRRLRGRKPGGGDPAGGGR